MTPSVLPTTGVVSRAAGGTGHAAASGTTTIAPGYDPSVIATITSASIDGTSFGCAAPVVVDTTGAPDSSVHPSIGSTSVAG